MARLKFSTKKLLLLMLIALFVYLMIIQTRSVLHITQKRLLPANFFTFGDWMHRHSKDVNKEFYSVSQAHQWMRTEVSTPAWKVKCIC